MGAEFATCRPPANGICELRATSVSVAVTLRASWLLRSVSTWSKAGRGLSTSSQRPNTKAQGIETDNLGATLEAVNDHGDHYAIRAADDADNAKLVAWAATRAAGGDARTLAVKAAIVSRVNNQGVETDV